MRVIVWGSWRILGLLISVVVLVEVWWWEKCCCWWRVWIGSGRNDLSLGWNGDELLLIGGGLEVVVVDFDWKSIWWLLKVDLPLVAAKVWDTNSSGKPILSSCSRPNFNWLSFSESCKERERERKCWEKERENGYQCKQMEFILEANAYLRAVWVYRDNHRSSYCSRICFDCDLFFGGRRGTKQNRKNTRSFLMIISCTLLCWNYHKEISMPVKPPRTALSVLRSLWRVRALLSFLHVSMHSILHVLRRGWLGTILLVLFVDFA